MNFEFVEYYPSPSKKGTCHLGTCHIYWVDAGMDIRYINVRREGSKIKFMLPWLYARSEDGGKIRCPVLSFTDRSKEKEIIKFCQEHVTPIVLKKEREDAGI